MALWMMGGGGWQAPFNRTFFNVTLGEIFARASREKPSRLTLYLIDGSQLDLSSIEDLSDQYLVARAFLHNEESSEGGLHVLPYTSIYRIEVAPSTDAQSRRLGFQWTPLAIGGRPGRKLAPKGGTTPPLNQGAQTPGATPAEGGAREAASRSPTP